MGLIGLGNCWGIGCLVFGGRVGLIGLGNWWGIRSVEDASGPVRSQTTAVLWWG